MRSPISWPDGLSGYAFRGVDENVYLEMENMREVPTTAAISIHSPLVTGKWLAANMLSGIAFAVKPLADGISIPLSLDGGNGTVIMLALPKK